LVLGGMFVAEPARKLDETLTNALRSVRADLIAQRQVQPHVQERIRLTALGRVIAVEHAIGIFQRGLVFRVHLDHVGDLRLERLHRQPLAPFAPRLDVHAAQLIAGLVVEEGHRIRLKAAD
jgi:hypothetical protein